MKKFFVGVVACLIAVSLSVSTVSASAFKTDDPAFELIPKTKTDGRADDAKRLWELWHKKDFWKEYNKYWETYAWQKEKDGLWKMLASGIVTWDTILILLTRVIKFIANAALVFGSAMFIYAWYLYVASALAWDHTWKANDAIKNAVIWVVIVIFSYAIQKIVVQWFLY